MAIEQLDSFMNAIIATESGGNPTIRNKDSGAYGLFQFMPATFRYAAGLAGVSTAWPPSEENQRAAAKALMTHYYEKHGSWRNVAISWYGGEGALKYSDAAKNRPQGKYASINSYADKVVSRMGGEDGGGTSASPATIDEIEQEVRDQYPEYAWLLDDPEIRDILLEAADPARGLDDAVFLSRIRNTDWYQNTTPSIRAWDTLVSQDPQDAARRIEKKAQEVRRQAIAMGVRVDMGEINDLAEKAMRYGWTEIEVTNNLATLLMDDEPAGAVQANLTEMRRKAREHLVTMPESTLVRWARGITTGAQTEADFDKALQEMAKAKFVGNNQITAMIDAGLTPGDFFADYQRLLGDEWGMATEMVDLTDPQWQSILQTKDENGTIRPMTLDEARKYTRQQEGWDKTNKGREVVSNTILGLLSQFGEVKL